MDVNIKKLIIVSLTVVGIKAYWTETYFKEPQLKRIPGRIPNTFMLEGRKVVRLVDSDFNKIVTRPGFVDKSLLIKTIFEETSPRILVTAPQGFGKSTNMDMVKRFLEIEVYPDRYRYYGNRPKDIKNTYNYKLFKNHSLHILKYEHFVDKHFGKYPVIFIDYTPLMGVTCYDGLIEAFSEILERTFEPHKYLDEFIELSDDPSLREQFKKSLFPQYYERPLLLKDISIMKSFQHLSEYLHIYYQKKTVVLIDGYDAYYFSILNNDCTKPNMDYIVKFINRTNGYLFENNNFVDRVILTGVLPVSDLSPPGANIGFHPFLHNHPLGKYYGLTEVEVDELLMKFVKNEKERKERKEEITMNFNGYTVMKQDIQIYKTSSVMNYLRKEKIITGAAPPTLDDFIREHGL